MEKITPQANSTRISKASPVNSKGASTPENPTPTEKPDENAEKAKQDPAPNGTQPSENKNEKQNELKTENPNPLKVEEVDKNQPINENQNSKQPKVEEDQGLATAHEKNEDLTKLKEPNQNVTTTEKTTQNVTNTEKTTQNLTKAKVEEDQGLATAHEKNEDLTKLKEPNQNVTTEKTTQNVTNTEKTTQNLTKAKAQEDPISDDEGSGGVSTGPLFQENEIDLYTTTAFEKEIKQDESELMKPSDQVAFSGGSKGFDHNYLPMVHLVLILWVVVYMYPKAKRFFNWIKKNVTKPGKDIRRRKKQNH